MELIPIQKAKALYNYYDDLLNKDFMNPIINHNQLIECALIAVDEILNSRVGYPYPQDVGLVVNGIYNIINYPEKYWQEVKQEIEKL